MARLIHLNGPPGIGKSTIARRYVAEHPGVLNCDIDLLRTLIGGWSEDFAGAGALIRPAALAMIEAYLGHGHDVVLPQMLIDPAQVELFESRAVAAGATYVERFLMDEQEASVQRFGRRGASRPEDPWHDQVRVIVERQGGETALVRCWVALEELQARRPSAQVVPSIEGAPEDTYRLLVESLSRGTRR
ncbi:AAA family ATPase [Nocardioides sp. 31GB23]|uniref:Kinase n=1 Tax=Nocardioides salarius TaxID=374513 RepID=A0ABS2MD62_9ACTN|nr:AAA family ATPase [Nocardioides salarius]MBM7509142.1 putative kinase [Nocardioides salarius]